MLNGLNWGNCPAGVYYTLHRVL